VGAGDGRQGSELMNILFVDQFSEPGGGQRCLIDLLAGIERRGCAARVMAPGAGKLLQWSRANGISTHQLPMAQYRNGSKTVRDAIRYAVDIPRVAAAIHGVVHRHAIDVVYVNGPRVLPATVGLSCPIMFHAHSVVAGAPRQVVQWSLQRTNATVMAASGFVARDHRDARVIYSGVADLQCGPRSFGARPARIGILGRIAPEKGHLDFIRASEIIGGQAAFLIYGDTLFSDSTYYRAVRAAAANTPVQFCGWTDDVSAALRQLDILAVPSGPAEAAPRVIMEALSAGTPVVAYRSGGIPELIEHGRTGELTDPDAASLARGILALIAAPDRMARLSRSGREEWSQRFRVEMFRDNVWNLIDRVARRNPHAELRSERATSGAR